MPERRAWEIDPSSLTNLVRQAPAAICILRGEELVFDFANEQYLKIVGRDDVVGKPLLDALPELRDQGFDVLLRNVMHTEEPFVGREVLIKLDRRGDGTTDDGFFDFIYSPLARRRWARDFSGHRRAYSSSKHGRFDELGCARTPREKPDRRGGSGRIRRARSGSRRAPSAGAESEGVLVRPRSSSRSSPTSPASPVADESDGPPA